MTAFEALRKKANLMQTEVSAALGVDRSTISKWETGEAFPRADKLRALAKLYGCTIDDMFSTPNEEE